MNVKSFLTWLGPLSLCIILVTVIGGILLFVFGSSFAPEKKALLRLRRKFEDGWIPDTEHTPIERAKALLAGAGVSHSLRTAQRVLAIAESASGAQSYSPADFAREEEERDTHDHRFTWPNFFASILIIIGLSGTLFSFMTVLNNNPIGALVKPDSTLDITRLQDFINKVYTGFGGAFAASLTGIGGTVVLLSIRAWALQERGKFYEALDVVSRLYLTPLFLQHEHSGEDRFATIVPLLKQAADQGKETSSKLAETATKLAALPGSISESSKSLSEASEAAKKAAQAATKSAESFGKAFAENSPVHRAMMDVKSATDQLRQEFTTLKTTRQDAIRPLLDATKSVKDACEQITKITEQTQTIIDQADIRARTDSTQLTQTQQELKTLMATLTANQNSFQILVVKNIEELHQIIQKNATSDWGTLTQEFKTLTAKLAPLQSLPVLIKSLENAIAQPPKPPTVVIDGSGIAIDTTRMENLLGAIVDRLERPALPQRIWKKIRDYWE